MFLGWFDYCQKFRVKKTTHIFGSSAEAVIYPILLLIVMWVLLWAEIVSHNDLITWGIRPKHVESWKGLLFMPLLHDTKDFGHILNNSLPTLLLVGALVYYYREIALKVFIGSWIGTGLGVWIFAADTGGYHIGMSGVIYALFGFLFVSGFFRKLMQLQALSLFVVFMYGSMIWGVFPQNTNISWEGHLSGFIIGVSFAVWYRKKGPKPPKYQFELEKEWGIEPPDLEGLWIRQQEELAQIKAEQEQNQNSLNNIHFVYHYVPKSVTEEKPSVDIENK